MDPMTIEMVACTDCNGDGCDSCHDRGIRPEHLQTTWSTQFQSWCVVITSLEVDPEVLISYAVDIDAWHQGGDPGYVIEFRLEGDHRSVGPEIYTERALRAALNH